MPLAHASFFPPSSAHRAILCPASVRLNAQLKGRETEPAAEGSVAHHIAEYCMKNSIAPYYLSGDWYHYMGHGVVLSDEDDEWACLDAMWSFKVDEEMVAALTGYISHCHHRPGERHVEIRVDISAYCPVPDQFGTSDHIAIDEDTIYVDDLKYGKGVKVAPHENWQAISYALGALDWIKKNDPLRFKKIKNVVIGIYQPRIDNIDEWLTTVDHIYGLGAYMRERYNLAWTDDPPFGPSPKACQFCKVPLCKAEMEHIPDQLIDGLPNDEEVSAATISKLFVTPEEAAEAWLLKPWWENFFRKLHDYLFKAVADGKVTDVVRMGESRGTRFWKDKDAARAFLEKCGVEELETEPKLISPAQAEKKLPKAAKERLQEFIGKKPGAPRLVPIKSEHRDYGESLLDDLDNLDEDDLGLD